MTTLTINGQKVKVSDDFLKLSPEQQNATVDEIAKSMGMQPAAPAVSPGTMPREDMTQGSQSALAAMSNMTQNPTVQPQPRSTWDAIKDNVVGVDDGVQSFGESLGTWLNRAGESATLGIVGDEASAAAYSALPGRTYEGELDRFRKNEEGMSTMGRLSADLAGAFVPGALGVGMMAKAPTLGNAMLRGAGIGMASGGTLGFMEGEGDVTERAKSAGMTALLGGGIGGLMPAATAGLRKAGEAFANRGVRKAAMEGVESVDDLIAKAGSKYDEARALGITATGDQTTKLADSMTDALRAEGLVSPTGRISSAYPKVTDALNMVMDYAEGEMTPTQMQQVRKLLQAAAGSADGQEARLGTKMLREFDSFVEPLAPQFKEANALYSRAKKGGMIDEAIELAGSRAGQFSGSGFENALRTEFRALDRKIIKGQLKGLSEAQIAAIRRVANGGPVENLMRDLGKMAPRGVVGTGITTGVPFAMGTAMGSPGLGMAMSAGALGLGEIGRRGATAMQRGNADYASALMRMAEAPAFKRLPNQIRAMIDAAMLAQSARPADALQEQLR